MAGVFQGFRHLLHTRQHGFCSHQQPAGYADLHPNFFDCTHRTFSERVAIWSAYAWGLNPYVWYWSIHWIWDTTFTPLLLACTFLVALKLAHVAPDAFVKAAPLPKEDFRTWILFGMLFGIGALANPTMLAFLPFCGLWIWRQRFQRALPSLAGIVLSSVIFFAVLSPWVVRNYEVFGRFVFLRDDFGLQIRFGNGSLCRRHADGLLAAKSQQA